ncbi:hypothetical protein NUH88_20500 [Nisaea acidiphila]|uniref:Uncharacterized protein n=1 Tax=Nisaea acidiphila TaxID=1862145 RepID=A0A9J7AQ80_9PROT|nr:hypothetical protein [Nisaea acidiphila]UUX49763.1 hypothetical protein NUH88_20500 [Nisaea acidiphila]
MDKPKRIQCCIATLSFSPACPIFLLSATEYSSELEPDMINEQIKKPRVYFSDTQRKWSLLQADAALEMIDGLSRHSENADPLGEPKLVVSNAA